MPGWWLSEPVWARGMQVSTHGAKVACDARCVFLGIEDVYIEGHDSHQGF
jgi:hypothetical protein